MTTTRFRLFVFDLDGTLVDSRRDLAESVNALLAECGAQPLPVDRVGRMVGDGAASLVARAFEARGIERPRDALARFLAIYETHLLDHTRAYPAIPAVLDALGSRASLALLTNKPLGSTRRILEGLDLARHFADTAVVGGDGAIPRKPDPAGLRQLMELGRVEPCDTLLVGDSVVDWRTAHAATTAVCLARYGFGFDGFPIASLRPEDRVIDAPEELLGM